MHTKVLFIKVVRHGSKVTFHVMQDRSSILFHPLVLEFLLMGLAVEFLVNHVGDPASARRVKVRYVENGKAHTVAGARVVLACYNSAIPYLCNELPPAQRTAHTAMVACLQRAWLIPRGVGKVRRIACLLSECMLCGGKQATRNTRVQAAPAAALAH